MCRLVASRRERLLQFASLTLVARFCSLLSVLIALRSLITRSPATGSAMTITEVRGMTIVGCRFVHIQLFQE